MIAAVLSTGLLGLLIALVGSTSFYWRISPMVWIATLSLIVLLWSFSWSWLDILWSAPILTLLVLGSLLLSPLQRFLGRSKDRRPSSGAVILYDPVEADTPVPEAEIEADILAVHGLGSDPDRAWTHQETQKNWLRDFLPSWRPAIRVIVVNHNSVWDADAARLSLRNHGQKALDAMVDARRNVDPRRPIILIAHSFGGILLQQALVLANEAGLDSPQRAVADALNGVIFLGTPHRGSRYALAGALFSLLSYWRGSSAQLLECLLPDAEGIDGLHHSFLKIYSSTYMFCFFEDLPVKIAGLPVSQVVPVQSAIIAGRPYSSLHADHKGLNKYCKSADEGFLLVQREIENARKHKRTKKPYLPPRLPYGGRDKNFVGRSALLQRMEEEVAEPHVHHRLTLSGMSGVGKTGLALEFAHRVHQKTPEISIHWVHASSRPRFEKDYRDIADGAKIPDRDNPEGNILELVRTWLEREGTERWMMVLDNADDASLFFHAEAPASGNSTDQREAELSTYLPQSPNGIILVTTRNKALGAKLCPSMPVIEVPKMTTDEGRLMLAKQLSLEKTSNSDVENLLDELEHLPLAIAQAAAYIRYNSLSISGYLQLLTENESQAVILLSKEFNDLRREKDVPNAVITTWIISFNQIKRDNVEAAGLLSFMSVLDRHGIPKSLAQRDRDEIHFTEILGILKAFHLIVVDESGDSFDVHRLVQLATKTWLEASHELEQWKEQALEVLSKSVPDYKNPLKCAIYLPHAELVLGYSATAEHSLLNRADLLGWTASHLADIGRHSVAVQKHKEALEIRKTHMGAEHPDTLISIANLASTYRKQGRWKEAEELDVQVMETWKQLLGLEHPDTVTSIANLASTYRNQGRWKEAEELDVQVMETSKQVLGLEHPSTLTSIANLASTYWNQGRWKEAEELDVQVMETSKQLLGLEHPSTLTSIANLASTYRNQGRWKEAEELEVQVMETRKQLLGLEHPSTLTSIANLASTYMNQGRWREAEELNVQVMETRKRVLGLEHPSTLTSIANLTYTYHSEGRRNEAKELMSECIMLREKTIGKDHPDTVDARQTLDEWTGEDSGWEDCSPSAHSHHVEMRRVVWPLWRSSTSA